MKAEKAFRVHPAAFFLVVANSRVEPSVKNIDKQITGYQQDGIDNRQAGQ